ncbi:hypothetical protein [Ruegeria arenilitoris]|uniref:hypothetical protein n=1 Tax=Ruegeria arenilitoris TaxID=1173585 RepID=UPI00147F690A|nr:hypothetical protein [Ruegeria arenilitoris]
MLSDREVVGQHLSEDTVRELKELFERVSAQRLDCIRFGEPPTGFNVSDKIRAYGQANLWRCVQQCRDAEVLRQSSCGLSAIILCRSVFETVASYSHFARQLPDKMKPLKTKSDLQRIDEFVLSKSFATRESSAKEMAASDGVDVEAVSIITQIKKLEKRHPNLWKKYEFVSEYAHPNGFGTLSWYGRTNSRERTVKFSDDWDDCERDALGWSVAAIALLETLEADIAGVEEQLPELSFSAHKIIAQQ